jgi:hypothetical protein
MSNARNIASIAGEDVLNASNEIVPVYACRAWVNFDGTNAFSPNPSTSAIRDSGNVSSIYQNGTGDFTVNYEKAMPDANYACLLMTSNRVAASGAYTAIGYYTTNNDDASAYLAGSIRILLKRADSTTVDNKGDISVAVFR